MSEGVSSLPCNVFLEGKLSWFAYVRKIIGFFIVLVVISIITALLTKYSVIAADISIVATSIGYWWLATLSIRAVKVYSDQDGIWVSSGIFPWSKRVRGVKWRDLDEAVYYQNFFSWLFKSYTVRLTHRYTKSSEVIVSDVWYGDNLVQKINECHIERIKMLDSQGRN